MVRVKRNIKYSNIDTQSDGGSLNIYYTKEAEFLQDVLIFIDGGSSKSKNKVLHEYMGRNFARKGLVAVIIDFPQLSSPIEEKVNDCTQAVIWIYQNISDYGGNHNRIFGMGYSIGGHLLELINSDKRYFNKYNLENPIHGLILLDAIGLDMDKYLTEYESENHKYHKKLMKVFSDDPNKWKEASPMTYLKYIHNPHLILIGRRTFPSIESQSKHLFGQLLISQQTSVEFYEIPRRTHKAMILCMFSRKNKHYDIILDFIGRN